MAHLSPRQREILTLVAAGRTSKEIAGELGISESTVNWHISNVFGRLGASSRAEAVALAMRDEAQGPDAPVDPAARPKVRPQLAMSSVALAVAVTLVLGLFGGALLAGWQFPPPISPPASAAPSPASADPTARPTGVPSRHQALDVPGLPTDALLTPAHRGGPSGSPELELVGVMPAERVPRRAGHVDPA